MTYPALPDRRIPYDNDGSTLKTRTPGSAYSFDNGPTYDLSSGERIELNDDDWVTVNATYFEAGASGSNLFLWVFFPEKREVTALVVGATRVAGSAPTITLEGSNDTTNGMDGTWEAASFPGGSPYIDESGDSWRDSIKAVSFTGGKTVLRMKVAWPGAGGASFKWRLAHVYGEKSAGETPDDLIFLDWDGSGNEFTAPEDFGDQPLGTTVVRQFRVKNTSATLTGNTLDLQCNDADFAIGESGSGPWVTTINISSLGPGAQSATLYTRCTTPAPGATLGPRFARIVATVGSWT